MPITRLRHADAPYTMLPVDTVQEVTDVVALGMWAYLQSQPEDWIVRQGQICAHFHIGRDKCRNAVKALKDVGLWTEEVEQGEGGKIIGRIATIHYKPVPLKTRRTVTTLLKNRRTEKPSAGKPPPTKEELIQKKKKNKIDRPDFISNTVWTRWLSYRSERGWPMTKTSTRMLVVKLESARAAGATPAELEAEIDTAIERGWRTVYPAALQKQPQRKKDWI